MSFSWENFDTAFLKSIIEASDMNEKELYLESDDKDVIVGCMMRICSYPDRRFIYDYRHIIDNELLPKYEKQVGEICKALKITERSRNGRLVALAKKRTTDTLANAYAAALLSISGLSIRPQEYSNFRYTKTLDMKTTKIEEVPLYDFQEDAVNALTEHFIHRDESCGMLVMPTGSGKSRTTSFFLIKEMISRGYQIIWLVHRHMLIDQAADCFYCFAGLSKLENPNIRNYRISCVSGEHLKMSQIDKHEVIIASISSVYRNKEHLARILGKKVMVVIDECHHTFAPSYQETIRFIKKHRKNMKLLGVTATPIRANDEDSEALMKIFGNQVVYTISLGVLIKKRILSDPQFERVETNEDIEPIISVDEERLIQRYGELPETLVGKIADSASRNRIIMEQYMQNRERYGKTLIFAMNVVHCRFLYDEFKKRGIRVGYIHSGKEDNTAVINDFKNNKLDVLINVNIMTEGTDVPDIQTVMLTRPTQSEGLLMQMIGRGMRGPKADHGTETVNVVDFHDKWSVFRKWLNPKWLINEERGEETCPEIQEHKAYSYQEYEWKMCQEIYNSIVVRSQILHEEVMIPVGWYTLCDREGVDMCMLVFESQMDGFLTMMKEKECWIHDDSVSAEEIIDKYFAGFGDKPSVSEMDTLLDNFRHNEYQPSLHALAHRKTVDPFYVAERAAREGKDAIDLAAEIYDAYPIARDLFPSKEVYQEKVSKAKIYRNKRIVIGQKIEELPIEWIEFDRTPYHDLKKLAAEVVDEMFSGSYPGIGNISWTDKPYKGFFGRFWQESHNIEINCVLNSKDVHPEVIKFLLYHEMLHRDMPYHDNTFREEEHRYPRWEYHQNFLFDKMNRFDIREW